MHGFFQNFVQWDKMSMVGGVGDKDLSVAMLAGVNLQSAQMLKFTKPKIFQGGKPEPRGRQMLPLPPERKPATQT